MVIQEAPNLSIPSPWGIVANFEYHGGPVNVLGQYFLAFPSITEIPFATLSLAASGITLTLENKVGNVSLTKLFVVTSLESKCYGVEISILHVHNIHSHNLNNSLNLLIIILIISSILIISISSNTHPFWADCEY